MAKSILIIDDSEADQYLWSYLIKKYDEDIEVLQAYDGEEGLDVFSKMQNKPDLILVDVNMPRMDGFYFLELFVEKFPKTNVRIAMLSSSNHDNDKDKVKSFPIRIDYIVKPLTKEHLTKLLN